MDWKSLLILSAVNVIYILVGAAIFHGLESSYEEKMKATMKQTFYNFLANRSCVTKDELRTFVLEVLAAYDDGVYSTDTVSSFSHWTYDKAVSFAITAVTTIGYGNQTPATSGGKAFTCIFALIGIPPMLVMIAAYGVKMKKLLYPLKKRIWIENHVRLDRVFKISTLILTGVVLIFLIPAAIFSSLEGWGFGDGIYFTIITLTTIGFGDFVVGSSESGKSILYLLLFSIWLFIGLVWVTFIISIVQNLYTRIFEKEQQNEEKEDGKESNEKEPQYVNTCQTANRTHGQGSDEQVGVANAI